MNASHLRHGMCISGFLASTEHSIVVWSAVVFYHRFYQRLKTEITLCDCIVVVGQLYASLRGLRDVRVCLFSAPWWVAPTLWWAKEKEEKLTSTLQSFDSTMLLHKVCLARLMCWPHFG